METSNPKSDYNFSMVSLNVYLLDCFGMKLVYRSCAAGLWKCDSIALLWDRPASWHPCRTISSSGRTKNRTCTPFFRSIHSLMLLASIFSVTSSRDNSFRSSYVADIYWDSWVISLYCCARILRQVLLELSIFDPPARQSSFSSVELLDSF